MTVPLDGLVFMRYSIHMNTTEVKQVEAKTDYMIESLIQDRDYYQERLNKVVADGADELDPMRNWLEGQACAFSKALRIVKWFS